MSCITTGNGHKISSNICLLDFDNYYDNTTKYKNIVIKEVAVAGGPREEAQIQ